MISSFDFIIFFNVFIAMIFVSDAYIPDASLSVVSITTQSRRFRYNIHTSKSFCFKYPFIEIIIFNIFFVKLSSLRYLLPIKVQPEGRSVPGPDHPLSHTYAYNGLFKKMIAHLLTTTIICYC